MSARKTEYFRTPKTLNERKQTATFIKSEDGRTINIRAKRINLPDAWDDKAHAGSKVIKHHVKAGDPVWTNSYESQAKIIRMKYRRLARKMKQVLKEELAYREEGTYLDEDDFWEIQYDRACSEAGVDSLIVD